MMVPSRNTMPSARPQRSCTSPSSRPQTPSLDQRMKVCAACHQGPSSEGMDRHLAPLPCRQTIASIVRRRSWIGLAAQGLASLSSGSSTAHSLSLITRNTIRPSTLAVEGRRRRRFSRSL
jgi:hypothetical protein